MVIVIGHKNPDTDTVGSALLLAHLLGDAHARVLGPLNNETSFVLERFGVDAPELITSAGDEDVWIVDHTEKAQAPDDLKAEQIVGIVDHHKLGDLQTTRPPSVRIEPLGSTATVIAKMAEERGIEFPDDLKGVLLACILSDTVILKSPTTTEDDRRVAARIASQIGEDVIELGKAQFAAKADFGSKTPAEVLGIDMKVYEMGGRTFAIAQVEVSDASVIDDSVYVEAMGSLCSSEGYDAFVFAVTDIIEEGSRIVVSGMEEEIGAALGLELSSGSAWAPGVMSRKKQIVPPLQESLG